MSCCDCTANYPTPFELTLPLGSAPSWPFTLIDDSVSPNAAIDITSASLWFAVKSAPTDADADALIFASTSAGNIVITSAEDGEAQVDLTESDAAETEDLLPNRTYFAYLKVQLSSGETRVKAGYVHTVDGGIEAP